MWLECLFGLALALFCGIVWLKCLKRPAMSAADQIEEMMVAECWRTGKTIMGTVDENGELKITVIDDED